MMQIDGYIHMGNLLDEALKSEIWRVSVLQRMVNFIRWKLVGPDMHTHQVRRRPKSFLPDVSDIHQCRTSQDLLNPLMSRTSRDHLCLLMDDAHCNDPDL